MSTIFQIASALAFFAWLGLALFPKKQVTISLTKYGVISLLAIAYVILLAPLLSDFKPDSFNSLESVKGLFKGDRGVTAGWLHYLAFDLFVGIYIVENGIKQGFKRWQYTICLPFTFMFGPVGLLVFYLVKVLKKPSV